MSSPASKRSPVQARDAATPPRLRQGLRELLKLDAEGGGGGGGGVGGGGGEIKEHAGTTDGGRGESKDASDPTRRIKGALARAVSASNVKLHDVFLVLDTGHKGWLSRKELVAGLQELGLGEEVGLEGLEAFSSRLEKSGRIYFQQFWNAFAVHKPSPSRPTWKPPPPRSPEEACSPEKARHGRGEQVAAPAAAGEAHSRESAEIRRALAVLTPLQRVESSEAPPQVQELWFRWSADDSRTSDSTDARTQSSHVEPDHPQQGDAEELQRAVLRAEVEDLLASRIPLPVNSGAVTSAPIPADVDVPDDRGVSHGDEPASAEGGVHVLESRSIREPSSPSPESSALASSTGVVVSHHAEDRDNPFAVEHEETTVEELGPDEQIRSSSRADADTSEAGSENPSTTWELKEPAEAAAAESSSAHRGSLSEHGTVTSGIPEGGSVRDLKGNSGRGATATRAPQARVVCRLTPPHYHDLSTVLCVRLPPDSLSDTSIVVCDASQRGSIVHTFAFDAVARDPRGGFLADGAFRSELGSVLSGMPDKQGALILSCAEASSSITSRAVSAFFDTMSRAGAAKTGGVATLTCLDVHGDRIVDLLAAQEELHDESFNRVRGPLGETCAAVVASKTEASLRIAACASQRTGPSSRSSHFVVSLRPESAGSREALPMVRIVELADALPSEHPDAEAVNRALNSVAAVVRYVRGADASGHNNVRQPPDGLLPLADSSALGGLLREAFEASPQGCAMLMYLSVPERPMDFGSLATPLMFASASDEDTDAPPDRARWTGGDSWAVDLQCVNPRVQSAFADVLTFAFERHRELLNSSAGGHSQAVAVGGAAYGIPHSIREATLAEYRPAGPVAAGMYVENDGEGVYGDWGGGDDAYQYHVQQAFPVPPLAAPVRPPSVLHYPQRDTPSRNTQAPAPAERSRYQAMDAGFAADSGMLPPVPVGLQRLSAEEKLRETRRMIARALRSKDRDFLRASVASASSSSSGGLTPAELRRILHRIAPELPHGDIARFVNSMTQENGRIRVEAFLDAVGKSSLGVSTFVKCIYASSPLSTYAQNASLSAARCSSSARIRSLCFLHCFHKGRLSSR